MSGANILLRPVLLVSIDMKDGYMRRYAGIKNVAAPAGEAQFQNWNMTVRSQELECFECIQNFRIHGLPEEAKK